MALKIVLKPKEKLIIGGAVIANGDVKTELVVENNVPVLRQKDIISLKDADSPCKKIYFVIQLMYVDSTNLAEHHKAYWELVTDVLKAAPSQNMLLNQISEHILHDQHYQALKLTRKLIEYEQEAMNNARNSARNI